MAEDRFANIFTAAITMSSANTLTFLEMVFGITLRDRIALVIDELFFHIDNAAILEMTTSGDNIQLAICGSDQVTNITDLADRRIWYSTTLGRMDFGTAAAGQLYLKPIKASFAPPLIVLPNRVFLAMGSSGLASAAGAQLRMHYRTVNITQDQQLIEVLETFQMSS